MQLEAFGLDRIKQPGKLLIFFYFTLFYFHRFQNNFYNNFVSLKFLCKKLEFYFIKFSLFTLNFQVSISFLMRLSCLSVVLAYVSLKLNTNVR